MIAEYPQVVDLADQTLRRVDYFCRQADLIVRNLQVGYLPKWDMLWPTFLAIDQADWTPPDELSRSTEIVVVHSSNHRMIKGTNTVIAVVEQLRSEGLPIRLELLEAFPILLCARRSGAVTS